MSAVAPMIPPAEALNLQSLITPTEQGIAIHVLAKNAGGNLTLFAFDAGQGLTEHTSPFDALVMVLEGALIVTIGGTPSAPLRVPSSACPPMCLMPSTRRRRPACCSSCCGTPGTAG